MELRRLADALTDAGLLRDTEVEDTFVYGLGHLQAADADVMVNVDPDLEEEPDAEIAPLVERTAAFLAAPRARWAALVEEIVSEIEEAAGDEPVLQSVDLREDIELASVVVFADAVLLAFVAPLQFPDAVIQAQLDVDHELEDLSIEFQEGEDDDEDGAGAAGGAGDDRMPAMVFDDLDGLLDHLTKDD